MYPMVKTHGKLFSVVRVGERSGLYHFHCVDVFRQMAIHSTKIRKWQESHHCGLAVWRRQVSVSLIVSRVLCHGLHGKPAFTLVSTVRSSYFFLENPLEVRAGNF